MIFILQIGLKVRGGLSQIMEKQHYLKYFFQIGIKIVKVENLHPQAVDPAQMSFQQYPGMGVDLSTHGSDRSIPPLDNNYQPIVHERARQAVHTRYQRIQ